MPLVEDQTWGWLSRSWWLAATVSAQANAMVTLGDWAIGNQGGENHARALLPGGSPLEVSEAPGLTLSQLSCSRSKGLFGGKRGQHTARRCSGGSNRSGGRPSAFRTRSGKHRIS
jgi:hypothetical protein